jgi:predicted transcriptional regulator
MTVNLKNVLARAESWSEQDQEELAQVALEIEARRHGLYHASAEELKAIDEALAAVARGEIATDEEVEALFAKYRSA